VLDLLVEEEIRNQPELQILHPINM
jgi:hypothetical protein